MSRLTPRGLILFASLLCAAARAQEGDIVFAAATNLTEPLAHFEGNQLRTGIVKDLGDALAQRLGLKPRYVSLPGLRVHDALRNGSVDLICYVLPGWLDGDFQWTVPVLPNAEVVAARIDAAPIRRLEDLEGKRVGTVNGYRYTHMLPTPGQSLPFEREDAIDTRGVLAKLAAGRTAYAIAEELAVRNYLQMHPDAPLRIDFVVARYTAQCALSKSSKIPLERVNEGLNALLKDGEVRRILSRYGG